MISRETANTLLEEFSRQQEIEPLQLDDANYCALASADDHVVHLRFDEGQGTFIAFGSIGTLSEDEEVALRELRALLTANLMWQDTQGATITLAPESWARNCTGCCPTCRRGSWPGRSRRPISRCSTNRAGASSAAICNIWDAGALE